MTTTRTQPAAPVYVPLDKRALLAISGEDGRSFLQGLITNDVDTLTPDHAIYAALLTPQGKYLYDFFLVEHDGAIFLDCAADRRNELKRRLAMYKLRAKVVIDDAADDLQPYALIGRGAPEALGLREEPGHCRPFRGGVAYIDPRLTAMGARAILPAESAAALLTNGFSAADAATYDALRISLGVPDSGIDLVPEKSFPLECGFEELNGVDFDKGCYVGQEVTARMKHRSLVRRRLFPVAFNGPTPETGASVTRDGADAGEIRSVADGTGLALLKLDHARAAIELGETLATDDASARPERPDWMRLDRD